MNMKPIAPSVLTNVSTEAKLISMKIDNTVATNPSIIIEYGIQIGEDFVHKPDIIMTGSILMELGNNIPMLNPVDRTIIGSINLQTLLATVYSIFAFSQEIVKPYIEQEQQAEVFNDADSNIDTPK